MKANLKAILSFMGVAALLVSPAMAKTVRPQTATKYIPVDARGSVTPYGANEGGPYTPSLPAPRYGLRTDFQNGNAN
jgi:hypothetical protein